MKVIDVETPFSHAEDGINVVEYKPGEQVVSDRCAEVAVKHLKAAKSTKKDPEKFAAEQSEEDQSAAE